MHPGLGARQLADTAAHAEDAPADDAAVGAEGRCGDAGGAARRGPICWGGRSADASWQPTIAGGAADAATLATAVKASLEGCAPPCGLCNTFVAYWT